jgi:hypothetical protein
MGNQDKCVEELNAEYQEIEDEMATSGEFKALVIVKSLRELLRREAIAIIGRMT